MQRLALVASVALVALGPLGCARLRGRTPAEVAPIVYAKTPGRLFDEEAAPTQPDQEPKKQADGPRIELRAYLFSIGADQLQALGIDPAEPATLVEPRQRGKLFEALASPRRGTILHAPRLLVVSGQRATVSVLTNYNYVSAVDLKDDEPTIGNVPVGLILAFTASRQGDATALAQLDVRLTALTRVCACEGCVLRDGQRVELGWQEPLVLVARDQVAPDARLVVAKGKSVLLPLRRTLVVGRSACRTVIKDGKALMERDGTAEFLARFGDRGYPVYEPPLFALLTPKLAGAATAAKER